MNTCLSNASTGRPVSGSSISGHLTLRCENRADGVPIISQQSFRAPIHLSKSYIDQGQRVLSIVKPTAGFFDGDQLETKIHVGAGARLVLSTPSASRVYRTRSGTVAVNAQQFRIEEDAALEWIPEPFIPRAGARYVQRAKIDLHPGATLLFFDWIAPGRVAMGEVFAYQNLRWEFDLFLGEALIARERYDLTPGGDSLEALRAKFPAAHYLSIYASGKMTRHWPAEALDALTSEQVYLGHGPLSGGVYVIRALCQDSLSARKLIEGLRVLLLPPRKKNRLLWVGFFVEKEKARTCFQNPRLIHIPSRWSGRTLQTSFPPEPSLHDCLREVATKVEIVSTL
jgi:urease accessory protein